MRFAKILTLAACASAFAGAAFAASDIIKYRQNNMKAIGAHMQSVVALAKGEVDYPDQLAAHARALADTAAFTKAVFKPEETDKDSTAKADIWKHWDEFAKGSDAMKAAADKLAAAAAGGDKGALRASLGELGKTCKGCHDEFRVKHNH